MGVLSAMFWPLICCDWQLPSSCNDCCSAFINISPLLLHFRSETFLVHNVMGAMLSSVTLVAATIRGSPSFLSNILCADLVALLFNSCASSASKMSFSSASKIQCLRSWGQNSPGLLKCWNIPSTGVFTTQSSSSCYIHCTDYYALQI